MDACREHEERDREHREAHQQGQPVRSAAHDEQHDEDGSHEQGGPDRDRGHDPEVGAAGPALLGAEGRVADPLPRAGKAHARLGRDQCPGVVGVQRDVRVPATGDGDLLDQADRCQPEGDREEDGGDEAGETRRDDPHRATGTFLVALAAGRPQRPPDRDDRDERDEDPELRLDDGRDDRVHRRALGPIAPQLAQTQQQEDDAERIDLPPDDAVEPADRVQDRDEGAREREPATPTELEDHRVDEPADREVRDDRRDLDEVADAAQRLADEADEPQDVQVARRVVVEEVAPVEAPRALVGEVRRPVPERGQVDPEAGSRQQVCDDEAEGEPEREDDHDRADGSAHPGRPRRRSRASLGPAGCGAGHRGRLLHERGRWIGA